MAAFQRRYRDKLAMPLLASSCALALWATAAGAEALSRESSRADSAAWLASHSSPQMPGGPKPVSGVFQASLSSRYGVGAFSLQANEDAGNPTIRRLDTTWITALPGRHDTLRLGDSIDEEGTWGHPVRFGGLHYGTNLGGGPGFVAPLSWPTTGSRLLPAPANAPYALHSMPQGEPAITQAPHAGFALLRPGLVDRAYAVGFLRNNYGLDGDRYGPLFASATLRRGISDGVTTELRGSTQQEVASGGIAFLVRVQGLGVLSAATAVSRSEAGIGSLAQTGFEYRRAGFSASIRSQWTSSEFRDSGVGDEGIPPRHSSVACATYDAARHGVFGLGYAALAHYNEALRRIAQGTYRVAVGRVSTLTLSVSRTVSPEPDTSLMLMLTFPLDQGRASASAPER